MTNLHDSYGSITTASLEREVVKMLPISLVEDTIFNSTTVENIKLCRNLLPIPFRRRVSHLQWPRYPDSGNADPACPQLSTCHFVSFHDVKLKQLTSSCLDSSYHAEF